MPDLAVIHESLAALRNDLLVDPRNEMEGLDRASCPPHVKHLAVLAAGSAAEGRNAEEWRRWVIDGVALDIEPLLRTAELCMKDSGLWPWPD
ncbi:MAG TPA: hypothetical protein VFL94_16785 [Actinomycetales bacterium]|nr:hypothetical protein [Actinomycetales bacterium]